MQLQFQSAGRGLSGGNDGDDGDGVDDDDDGGGGVGDDDDDGGGGVVDDDDGGGGVGDDACRQFCYWHFTQNVILTRRLQQQRTLMVEHRLQTPTIASTRPHLPAQLSLHSATAVHGVDRRGPAASAANAFTRVRSTATCERTAANALSRATSATVLSPTVAILRDTWQLSIPASADSSVTSAVGRFHPLTI